MKFWEKAVAVALGGMLVLSAVGCGGGGSSWEDENPSIIQADDTDRSGWVPFEKATFAEGTKLRIKFFKGGYGRKWLDAMKAKFEEDYPGVEVILTPSTNEADFTQTITTTLQTASPDDIYVCHNIPWQRLSVNNLIMNLDNLFNSVVYTDTKKDNAPIRFVDRIAASSLNTLQFKGHFYSIPEIQGAGGIAYNKTMFDKYGWEVPETYAELTALCEKIASEKRKMEDGETITPFVWSGTTAYLWDSIVYDWWVQIAGMDEFNEFMRYENKEMFNAEKFPSLKKAWTYWYDLLCKNGNYSHGQSTALDNLQCNMAFVSGQAAMMPATCWVANEVGAETLKEFGCDIGMIPTPAVPEAKKDSEGKLIRVAYDMAGKDAFIIAQKGKNKQVAVEFFKWMALEENALLFPQNTNGLLLAMKYDTKNLLENVAKTTWEKDMFSLLTTANRFNLYSSSPMVINAGTPLSPYPMGNYYLEAFETYGDSEGEVTPDSVFSAVWEKIDREWDMMRAAVGLS